MDTGCHRVRSGLGDRAACAKHATPWPCRIRALSMTRPWSELVVNSVKDVENRSWSTPWRGWLVVHAAKSWDDAAVALVRELAEDGMLTDRDWQHLDACAMDRDRCPTGFLGAIRVTDCHRWDDLMCAVSRGTDGRCSPWAFEGSFHWQVSDAVRFPEVVPGPGSLGLFEPAGDVLGRVRDLMWEAGCRD